MMLFQKMFQHTDPAVIHQAVQLQNSGIEFEVNYYNVLARKNGKIIGKALLPKATATILKGTIDPVSLNVCRQIVKQMINLLDAGDTHVVVPSTGQKGLQELMAHASGPTPMVEIKIESDGSDTDALLEALKPKKKAVKPKAPSKVALNTATDPVLTVDHLSGLVTGMASDSPGSKSAEPKPTKHRVKLAKTEALLQPVYGTSEGSMYYSVMIGPEFKLAIRKKGTQLSLRAEAITSAGKQHLQQFGFSEASDNHWSMHIETGTDLLRAKTYGAIIGGMISQGVPVTRFVSSLLEVPNEG